MIDVSPPTVTRASTVTINGVVLPAPQVNDTRTVQLTRVNRQTRGLKRRIFRTTDWYRLRIMEWSFVNLTLAEKNDFIAAVKTASSITVIDHMTETRTMYVQEINVTEEVRNDQCSYTVGLSVFDVN